MKQFFTQYPVFLYLLPVFFVLHGFTENYNFIPVKASLLLVGIYLCAAFLLSLISWLLFRNFIKASIIAFLLLGFQFFFGSVHDTIKNIFPGSFVAKYSFVLPAAGLLLIIAVIIVKKRKTKLQRFTYYLNTLMLVLILIDVGMLVTKIARPAKLMTELPAGFVACDTCSKPDIYFIVADEYAGNRELKDQFSFDNIAFINELASRNFHTIPESHSNYNYTPFSVGSILNMDYIDLAGKVRTTPNLTYSYEVIRDNKLLQFLQFHRYKFYNHSIFDFEGEPASTGEGFLPSKTKLITSQTFLNRFDRDIRFNLVTRWRLKKNLTILTYAYKKNNAKIYDMTWKLAEQPTTEPRFVYTHLEMPHYPYYYDKDGKELPFEKLLEENQVNKADYIGYLQYANKKLLTLVDHILKKSSRPPIIILMGDHGFRHFTEPVANEYYFLNLATVHLPSRNYAAFKDSLSGVNMFRALLNTQFSQRLPFLKDSTSYLND